MAKIVGFTGIRGILFSLKQDSRKRWEWHLSPCRVEIWKRTAGRVKYRIHWVVKGSSKYTDTCKQVGIMEVLSATLCYTYISSVNKVCNTNTATNRALTGEILIHLLPFKMLTEQGIPRLCEIFLPFVTSDCFVTLVQNWNRWISHTLQEYFTIC